MTKSITRKAIFEKTFPIVCSLISGYGGKKRKGRGDRKKREIKRKEERDQRKRKADEEQRLGFCGRRIEENEKCCDDCTKSQRQKLLGIESLVTQVIVTNEKEK